MKTMSRATQSQVRSTGVSKSLLAGHESQQAHTQRQFYNNKMIRDSRGARSGYDQKRDAEIVSRIVSTLTDKGVPSIKAGDGDVFNLTFTSKFVVSKKTMGTLLISNDNVTGINLLLNLSRVLVLNGASYRDSRA